MLSPLCMCRLGAWFLEQPQGSTLEYYPAFRHTLQMIFHFGGVRAVIILACVATCICEQQCICMLCIREPNGMPLLWKPLQVTRSAWWMAHYDADTPKRHYCYADAPQVSSLPKGRRRNTRTSRRQPSGRFSQMAGSRIKGRALCEAQSILAVLSTQLMHAAADGISEAVSYGIRHQDGQPLF